MLKAIQERFALSHKGAKDFLIGTLCTTVQNMSLMLPAVCMFSFLNDYLPYMLQTSATVQNDVGYYILLGLIFMFIMWVIAIIQYRSTFISVYEESANRRISLAEKLRRLPLAFFGEKNLSDLTSTIMEDCTDLEHTFSHAVPQLFASILGIFLMAIGLFIYNWKLSVALFWVVPLAMIIFLISKNLQRKEFQTGYYKKRKVSEHIQEGLETVEEIKSYNQENLYVNEMNAHLDAYEKQLVKGELLVGGLVNSAQILLKLGLVSVIIVGVHLLVSNGVDILTFLVFLIVASRIYAPIGEVFNNLAALFYLDVRIRRMNEMERLPIQQGVATGNIGRYDIVFDDVSFSYEKNKQVIHHISFTAKQGEITALVGPSGGGKSTCAKLAARFWDCDSGRILLGGIDISTIDPETLLQYFSIVFQDVVLFNTTIMENIRIGRREATDDEVLHVAKLAQCDDFVSKMPLGYHTIIGENGDTLSGGERQRISIARALLKDAPIVLLDEATASLDVENETKIQSALTKLIQNKTVLIIAHRMRTIMHANLIVVIKDGLLVEKGTSKQLLGKQGEFNHMWNFQQESVEWNL